MARTIGVWVGVAAVALLLTLAGGTAQTSLTTADHPAVGSYYGLAIQVCPSGVAPSACSGGRPAAALLMTPSLLSDGLFVADDSLDLLDAPFGPHTAAHGTWLPTGPTEFSAEYVFMNRPFPPVASGVSVSGLRARWQGKVLDKDTLVGWVNAYFLDPVPVKWARLILEEDFPALPAEAVPFYTPPGDFVKDPSLCRTDGCPQVFKFTVKRIRR